MQIGSAQDWGDWTVRGWSLWISVALAMAGALTYILAPQTQATVRRIGLVYEVVGVAVVLVELVRAMKKHDIPWPWIRLARYLADWPPIRKPRIFEGSVSDSVIATDSASAEVHTAWVFDGSVEGRLKALEKETRSLRNDVKWALDLARKEKRERELAVEQASQQIHGARERIAQSIKEIEVGSLGLSLFGLLWLLVGMVMTTGTEEVCWLLSWVELLSCVKP